MTVWHDTVCPPPPTDVCRYSLVNPEPSPFDAVATFRWICMVFLLEYYYFRLHHLLLFYLSAAENVVDELPTLVSTCRSYSLRFLLKNSFDVILFDSDDWMTRQRIPNSNPSDGGSASSVDMYVYCLNGFSAEAPSSADVTPLQTSS